MSRNYCNEIEQTYRVPWNNLQGVVSSTNLMRRCQSHRNLFVITAKTITPSFVPIGYSSFQSSPIRQSSSDSNCLLPVGQEGPARSISGGQDGLLVWPALASVMWSIRSNPFVKSVKNSRAEATPLSTASWTACNMYKRASVVEYPLGAYSLDLFMM